MSLKISSGPLFVRIGGRYVQTEHTVEEFDQLRAMSHSAGGMT